MASAVAGSQLRQISPNTFCDALRGAGATNKEHRIARLPRCEAGRE